MTDGRRLTDQRPDGRSRTDGICLATETEIRAGRVPDILRFGKVVTSSCQSGKSSFGQSKAQPDASSRRPACRGGFQRVFVGGAGFFPTLFEARSPVWSGRN